MATVRAFVRTGKDTKNIKNRGVNVRFRLRAGRGIQLFHKSEFTIGADKWNAKKQEIKSGCVYDAEKRIEFNKAIYDRKQLILKIFNANLAKKEFMTSEWLNVEIDRSMYPEKYESAEKSFFDIFDEFLMKQQISKSRKNNFRLVIRALKRYELYVRETEREKKDFSLSLDTVTPDTLQSISDFFKSEHVYCNVFKQLYEVFPEYRKPKPRGQNTINDMMKKIRTFFIYANDGLTSNNPFRKFKIEECIYGTPYYISIDERNALYRTDMSNTPELETQRDIFIFQCVIGCRIGDLYKLTKKNVINDAIEYIARKTRDSKPVTVRVPLNSIAKEILRKYADCCGDSLLPFVDGKKYNAAIKTAFGTAGITRQVTILDSLTRESAVKPINEAASSHLARRCFIGNLYKQVKDPNLVGSLSGHTEGSRAFARYRQIDEDMKKELVKMLE
jgi:integrase